VCLVLQALVAKVFKALHQGAQALGIKMGDLRSSVALGLMPPFDLQQAVHSAVCSSLLAAGWTQLNGAAGSFLSVDWAKCTEPCIALEADVDAVHQHPSTVLLHVSRASAWLTLQSHTSCRTWPRVCYVPPGATAELK
jgi:hypothetical protein